MDHVIVFFSLGNDRETIVSLGDHGLNVTIDVGINYGRFEIRMTEALLDETQVMASHIKDRSESMTKIMRSTFQADFEKK